MNKILYLIFFLFISGCGGSGASAEDDENSSLKYADLIGVWDSECIHEVGTEVQAEQLIVQLDGLGFYDPDVGVYFYRTFYLDNESIRVEYSIHEDSECEDDYMSETGLDVLFVVLSGGHEIDYSEQFITDENFEAVSITLQSSQFEFMDAIGFTSVDGFLYRVLIGDDGSRVTDFSVRYTKK